MSGGLCQNLSIRVLKYVTINDRAPRGVGSIDAPVRLAYMVSSNVA